MSPRRLTSPIPALSWRAHPPRVGLGFCARLLPLALIGMLPVFAQTPEVHERRLPNGVRILLVERPGSGAVHLRLLFRGGLAEFADASPPALRLMARAAFFRMDEAERGQAPDLDVLLGRISGASESLRQADQRWVRTGLPDPLESDLKGLLESQLANLRAQLPHGQDQLEALGAVRRSVRVEADFIETALDLPAAALGAWADLEVARLTTLRLPRLPLLLPRTAHEEGSTGLDVLFGAALLGHPYGRGSGGNPLVQVPWAEARSLAKRALSPDRLVLVAVGDLRQEQAMPILEKQFARLPLASPSPREGITPEGPELAGARRLLATTTQEPTYLAGWRIPPADHPDTAALRLLAAALGDGSSALLRRAMVDSGLAREVRVLFGVPGQRGPRLLVIEAHPEPGHNLQELALAVDGEILRLQQDPLGSEYLRRLQMGAQVGHLETLADPESLAKALGEASVGTGDWRASCAWYQALPAADNLQQVARRFLVPARRTEAFFESDPLEANQDVLERQLAAALLRLARAKGMDEAHSEELTRQTLRQLRMIPREDRQSLLNLLTAPGGKP